MEDHGKPVPPVPVYGGGGGGGSPHGSAHGSRTSLNRQRPTYGGAGGGYASAEAGPGAGV